MGKTLYPKFAITAWKIAIANRNNEGLMYHSDQGIQYICKDYIKTLKDNGIKISMSGKDNPYDKAYIESFIKTLKQEELSLWEYKNSSEAIERIRYFIENGYNRKGCIPL